MAFKNLHWGPCVCVLDSFSENSLVVVYPRRVDSFREFSLTYSLAPALAHSLFYCQLNMTHDAVSQTRFLAPVFLPSRIYSLSVYERGRDTHTQCCILTVTFPNYERNVNPREGERETILVFRLVKKCIELSLGCSLQNPPAVNSSSCLLRSGVLFSGCVVSEAFSFQYSVSSTFNL